MYVYIWKRHSRRKPDRSNLTSAKNRMQVHFLTSQKKIVQEATPKSRKTEVSETRREGEKAST